MESSLLGYDKWEDFNFPIVNVPFLSINIPSATARGVYVSQLIRYARACSKYQDFIERGKLLNSIRRLRFTVNPELCQSFTVMPEPVQSIRTLLNEENCSL